MSAEQEEENRKKTNPPKAHKTISSLPVMKKLNISLPNYMYRKPQK